MLFWFFWLLLVPFAVGKQKSTFISLQRMDAIADLAALALKYFSEDQYLEQATRLKSVFVTSEAVTAVAMELSSIWDETESAAYALTRMAKLIDEREGEEGQFSAVARIVRAMAASSLQRNVHMSVAGSEDFDYESYDSEDSRSYSYDGSESYDNLYKSSSSIFDKELWRIEELYRSGDLDAADELVQKWISSRWLGADGDLVFFDINGAAARGHYATLSAFILLGRELPALASFSPQQKADIAQNLMNATDAQLAPAVMKWLLTMDTFREDQLTLLKMIGEAAKVTLKGGRRNSITELFAEIEQIPQENSVKHLQEATNEDVKEEHNDNDDKIQEQVKGSEEKVKEKPIPEVPSEPVERPIEKPQENEPIKAQENSDDSSSRNPSGPWYLLLALILIVIFIICLSLVLYFIRNFRINNASQPAI